MKIKQFSCGAEVAFVLWVTFFYLKIDSNQTGFA